MHILVGVAAFLVADHHDCPTAESAEAGDDRRVVTVVAVAVQLEPVVDQPLNVVEGVRPVWLPCELDRMPDLLVGGCGDEAVELTLQPLELALETRAAQQRQALQLAQLLPQPELGLTRHSRRASAAARRSAASRIGERSHRRARA